MRMMLLIFVCGFAPFVESSIKLRRAAGSPISYPKGCTGAHKPATEPFCATGTIGFAGMFTVNMTVYVFDINDPTKSVHFHVELATHGVKPTGLNITGGGSAEVVKKEELGGAVAGSVTIEANTVGDGRGKYDPKTDTWTADIGIKATVEGDVFGHDAINLPISKVVTAHIGPNSDFGMEALFKETTGDSNNQGISIAFDLTMNTKNHDLFTWELIGEGQLHVWLHPLVNWKPSIDVIHKEFKIKL
ncbi:hypothetical protein Pmar_PMAR010972 [Perkinsus marinus ATCC 50983]|uniref:Uncharacterized protein n=1 Tax=Perkinsus marinus (strain ATCC 50983 / TXsc) TaxID=423536 RepID=C5LUH6_PERM5|nr:hypothetical protein Pmar_PMAR010972 [Perkinsus marinus ATCC 50983]EEQ99709.1 hypothetical protein Pmar_PMAR010972 [Perkinsus marinus ATCC 50983]|eukprot:XP_002766992.1 hypothetical protein Pmar_PMAR010972 [Perkinsus marinus ATCC 50983]